MPRKCKSACRLDDEKKYCVGCGRTIEEIRQAYADLTKEK
ncbi:MAG: DUF1289 domain-containing protein [Pseudohongiellaceae bacterium]